MIYIAPISRIESEALASLGGEHDNILRSSFRRLKTTGPNLDSHSQIDLLS